MRQIITLLGLFTLLGAAELTLAPLFTDHGVLQRGASVPVWGTAEAGESVTVSFSGQSVTGKADSSGKWMIHLKEMPASKEGKELSVTSQKDRITLSDIVIGEVWICSGQSNMKMPYANIQDISALTPRAENIRSFQVPRIVSFKEEETCEGQWKEAPPESAVAFSFAYHLEEMTDVPIGIILSCWGSSSIEAWMPRDMVETVPHFKQMMRNFDNDKKTRATIQATLDGPRPWSNKEDIFLRRQSNILYNAMIHPLIPYACKGIVWYQGERNTQSMFGELRKPFYKHNSGMLKYEETLKEWVKRYRKGWQNEEMEFLIVMLPGYGGLLPGGPTKEQLHPESYSWAWIRQSQLGVLDLPNTAVANTIDLGHITDIHPKDKLPIGQRLSLLAAKFLGKDLVSQGPTFKKAEVKLGKITVHFQNAEGLKTTDGAAPTGFWISQKNGPWFPATAALEGESVILSSPKVKTPTHVRYAFSGKPEVNLVNGADLPAYPFKTDTVVPTE